MSRKRKLFYLFLGKDSKLTLPPGSLLTVVSRDNHRCLVRRRRMSINRCGRLRPQIAAFGGKLQRAHGVCALPAAKLHAALDPFDAIAFHFTNNSGNIR